MPVMLPELCGRCKFIKGVVVLAWESQDEVLNSFEVEYLLRDPGTESGVPPDLTGHQERLKMHTQ